MNGCAKKFGVGRTSRWFRVIVGCLAIVLPAFSRLSSEAPSAGTVPFIFDDNRIFAELAFVRPDGTLRKALAYVDLGTPAPMLSENLFNELHVDGKKPLVLQIGELRMEVDSAAVSIYPKAHLTGENGKATTPVEAILPGSVMKDYQVVFGYARRSLTMARANTHAPKGIAVPCRVNDKTGLVSVEVVIAGQTYAVAVDTGSAYTWVRERTAQQWLKAHPEWKRGKGAVGESNMQTRADKTEASATILRIAEIGLGALRLKQIGALGIAASAPPFPPIPGPPLSGPPVPGESVVEGDFFDWYSKKAPEPVIGWLGGNVLKGFRITIDFPNRMTYWERASELDEHDLDQVGVTLETRDNEDGYFIAGIAEKAGRPTVDGVQPGDKLIQIDELRVEGATRGAIFFALHGKPGTVRTLVLDRRGKRLTVQVKTTAF